MCSRHGNLILTPGLLITTPLPTLAPNNLSKKHRIALGAMILTGNHNYKSVRFETIFGPVTIEDGVFIGAKSIVCPNVICRSHSVLAAGSVATSTLKEYGIYQGNPAEYKKERIIS